MSALEKALEAVTQWHTAFEADAIRAAGEEELASLRAELDEIRAQLERIVKVCESPVNRCHRTQKQMCEWLDFERAIIATVLAKYPAHPETKEKK